MEMYIGILSKLFVGFFGTIFVIRAVGKKALSELTPFDIIYSVILGGIVQEGLYDEKVHIGHILFALIVWGAVIYTVETLLQKRDGVTRRMKGQSSVIIYKGELNLKEIRKNHIEMEQLRSMLRAENCFSLKEVEHAVIEMNGQITLMKNDSAANRFTFLLVDEGVPEMDTLKSIKKNEEWLYESLAKNGYPTISDIIYAEWSEEGGFFIKTYDDCYNEILSIDG